MRAIAFSLILFSMISCSNYSGGFGSYDKPAKKSNAYYNPNFKLANSKLKLARPYTDLDNKGLNASNADTYSYFVFFENGYVLHNASYHTGANQKSSTNLNYDDIRSEDVGNYKLEGDTIYWATRAGYQNKKMTAYYTGLVLDSGIVIINSKFDKLKFLSL